MKKIIILIMLLYCFVCGATTFNSIAPQGSGGGLWSSNSSWNTSSNPGCTFNTNDVVNIVGGDSIYSNCQLNISGNPTIRIKNGAVLYLSAGFIISGSVTFDIESGGKLIIMGDVQLSGNATLDVSGGGFLTIYGDVITSGSAYDFDCNGNINIVGSGCSKCTSGGTICAESAALDITQEESQEENETTKEMVFDLFPNPTSTEEGFVINTTEESYIITIQDINGNVIDTKKFVGHPIEYKNNDLVKGIYFVKFIIGNKIINKKVVIL